MPDLRAAEQFAAGDAGAADADSAGDVEEFADVGAGGGEVFGEGAGLGVVLDQDGRCVASESRAQLADRVDAAPAEVGGDGDRSGGGVDGSLGDEGDPGRVHAALGHRAEAVRDEVSDLAQGGLRGDRGHVEGAAVLVDDGAAQVEGEHGDVVGADLGADAADPAAVECDHAVRAADRAGAVEFSFADQAALDQVGDQDRHGCLGQAAGGGEMGARLFAVLAQVAQHHAEVGAAQGGLVGGFGVARHDAARPGGPGGGRARAAAAGGAAARAGGAALRLPHVVS